MSGQDGMDRENCLLIGKVVKPHGIKGEVKVFAFSETPEAFAGYPRLWLVEEQSGRSEEFTVRSARPQGKAVVVALEGVVGRDRSEALVGREVWLEKSLLPDLADDEFYWHELEGMLVDDEQGVELGRITGLFSGGAHDILIVKRGGEEFLIPARDEFITEINRQSGRVSVCLPPGLLEINQRD